MKYREWMNQNSALITIGAVLILIGALYAIIRQQWGGGGTYKPIDVYYYDMSITSGTEMDRLFPGKSNDFPPIEAPSKAKAPDGSPTGVRAWVFSCGDCSDKSKWFIGFLETYTKEAKDAMVEITKPPAAGGAPAPPPMPTGAEMMAREQGHLISIPGEDKWVPYSGPQGLELIQRAQGKCGAEPGTRAVPCYPNS
jgi:hypothetical protein